MDMEVIKKDPQSSKNANVQNYDGTYKSFKWDKLKKYCEDLSYQNEVNIAYEAIDKHAENKKNDKHIALKFIKSNGIVEQYSYKSLQKLTNQFANVLISLGVKPKDSVFCICPRSIELFTSCFGILKTKAIFCPLYTAFGPQPILDRMIIADAKVLITTESIYKKKILEIRDKVTSLEKVILISETTKKPKIENILWFDELMLASSNEYKIPETFCSDESIIHFTSGTTGTPKAAVLTHEAVYSYALTGKLVLDMQDKDIFWCTADPGWVTGTSYGMIAPLVNKTTNLILENEFDAYQWLQVLQEHKVSIWYTAPTAIRMLMKSNLKIEENLTFPNLRFIASVGEPLNPQAIDWSLKFFNLPIHDNWWQSETGSIMIANFLSLEIRPGSMGKPVPGLEVDIVEIDRFGKVKIIEETYKSGIIAIKKGWPSMFQNYLHQHQKYQESFHGNYYLSGDLAYRDQDGYFWFVGRMDDLIKTAGHLVGPFEIENILMEHPKVIEAAIIGKQDATYGQIIKAFIVVKKGIKESSDLIDDISAFARSKLGSAIAPKEYEFISDLPKTRSGKIMRRLLRTKEQNISHGDTSSLMNPEAFI